MYLLSKMSSISLLIAFILLPSCLSDTWSLLYSFNVSTIAIVSSSSDGLSIVAGYYGGPLAYSLNGGSSWTQSTVSSHDWYGVASRGDGQVVIAQVYNNGGLYMSTNYGADWSPIQGAPNLDWNGISASDDGSTWIATADNPNAIYKSTDGGFTWNQVNSNVVLSGYQAYWSGVSYPR